MKANKGRLSFPKQTRLNVGSSLGQRDTDMPGVGNKALTTAAT